MFPLEHKEDRKKIIQLIKDILKDNIKLRVQNKTGGYSLVGQKLKKTTPRFNYQEYYREKSSE